MTSYSSGALVFRSASLQECHSSGALVFRSALSLKQILPLLFICSFRTLIRYITLFMVLYTRTNVSNTNCQFLILCYHQNSLGFIVKHILFQQFQLMIYSLFHCWVDIMHLLMWVASSLSTCVIPVLFNKNSSATITRSPFIKLIIYSMRFFIIKTFIKKIFASTISLFLRMKNLLNKS